MPIALPDKTGHRKPQKALQQGSARKATRERLVGVKEGAGRGGGGRQREACPHRRPRAVYQCAEGETALVRAGSSRPRSCAGVDNRLALSGPAASEAFRRVNTTERAALEGEGRGGEETPTRQWTKEKEEEGLLLPRCPFCGPRSPRAAQRGQRSPAEHPSGTVHIRPLYV